MMLDVMHLAAKMLVREALCQKLRHPCPRAAVSPARQYERRTRTPQQQITELAREMGRAVLVECDVIDVGQCNSSFRQTISDRLRRETGPMLLSTESFLLRRRD